MTSFARLEESWRIREPVRSNAKQRVQHTTLDHSVPIHRSEMLFPSKIVETVATRFAIATVTARVCARYDTGDSVI